MSDTTPEEHSATADVADVPTTTATATPVAATPTPTTAVATASPAPRTEGSLTIARYSQTYAVSRNPFGVAAVLPLIVLAFIGLEIAILVDTPVDRTLAGFMIFTAGVLLMPAIGLRGALTFDDEGVEFRRNKDFMTARWEHVVGLEYQKGPGVCVVIKGATLSRPNFRLTGGLKAHDGTVTIPVRLFGDRKFAILYEIRDRLPEAAWAPALAESKPGRSTQAIVFYTVAVVLCIVSIVAVYFAVKP